MRASIALTFTLLAAIAAAARASAATAEVEFVNPAKFTDAGTPTQYIDRDTNLGNLKRHFIEQATHLPADQKLFISVTDVDLAGSYEPWQLYSREVRIVREIYPPRIDLKFRLVAADGKVVKEGERSLRDNGFMSGPSFGYGGDNLRYEKVMLDAWFEKEFGKPAR
jgi:Protein of unknown function (DUF3016)